MSKRFSWIFLVLSGIFFFFIVGLTGYRIEDARQKNTAGARERFAELQARAQSLRDITGGFDAPQFKADMRNVFDAEPRLLLLAIRSADQGILYLVTRNRSFLKEPVSVSPDWRGTPAYQLSKGYEILQTGQVEDADMDAIFVIMGREDLYPVVRDDLYLFLAFLLVCAVIILIASGVQDEPSRGIGSPEPAGYQRPFEPMGPSPAMAPPPPVYTPAPQAPAAPPPASAAATVYVAPPMYATVPPPAPVAPPPPPPAVAAQGTASAPQAPPPAAPAPQPVFQAPPAPQPPARQPVSDEPQPAAPPPAARADSPWREYLEPRLEIELSRAESSDLDLALARLKLDNAQRDARLSLVIAELTRLIRESFPLHDMIFESGDDSCTLLLPDTEIDAAVHALEVLRKKIGATPLEGRSRTVSIGVSSRAGRLIDGRTLLDEAEVSLDKATREGGNQVIGFRADAARFRETLTESRA